MKRKYKLYMVIGLIISTYFIYYVFYSVPARNEQWMLDIEYLSDNLINGHIDLFHNLNQEYFKNKIERITTDIPNLSDEEIKMELVKLVSKVGDSHTYLSINRNTDKFYPVEYCWLGNNIYVEKIEARYMELLGFKLESINNIPITTVIDRISSVISYENNQWLKVKTAKMLSNANMLSILNLVELESAEFKFIDENRNVRIVKLEPNGVAELQDISKIAKNNAIRNLKIDLPKYETLFWFQYIKEDESMYFQYNQCIDFKTAKDYRLADYNLYPSFDLFCDNLFEEINKNNPRNLVIDLRNNTGGNPELMRSFIKRYFDEVENVKEIKIYVLIGKETYSSGVMACIDLEKNTNAIFIGEPTGGNVNGYANIRRFRLPYSKLYCYYSTSYYNLSKEYPENFYPDIYIYEYENLREGRDRALNFTRIKYN